MFTHTNGWSFGVQDEKEKWVPATKLGRLVLEKKIKTIEEIYLYSLPIKGE
jgi:small subunit ribosomal protein S2e